VISVAAAILDRVYTLASTVLPEEDRVDEPTAQLLRDSKQHAVVSPEKQAGESQLEYLMRSKKFWKEAHTLPTLRSLGVFHIPSDDVEEEAGDEATRRFLPVDGNFFGNGVFEALKLAEAAKHGRSGSEAGNCGA